MDRFSSIDALFDAMNLNTPYAPPEPNKPDPRRAFVRSKSSSSRSPLHDIYSPRSPLSNMWDGGSYYGPAGPFGPPNRVEELDDFALPRSMSVDGMNYPSRDTHHPSRSTVPPLSFAAAGQRLSFEQAAASMYAALVCAHQECRNTDKTFAEEVRGLERWLPREYVDSLWRVRIEWDGRPVNTAVAAAGGGALKLDPSVVCYESIVKRFTTALAGMRMSAPPEHAHAQTHHPSSHTSSPPFGAADSARLHLSWEVISSTMRKLQIALEAIEELMLLVRTRRDRMPLLLHEIADGMRLLESVREVWEVQPAGKSGGSDGKGKGKGRGREREMPQPGKAGGGGFEWEGFGGENAI